MKRRLLFVLLCGLLLTLFYVVPASADSTGFTIRNGVLTSYNGAGGVVTIPDGVTSVGADAFRGNKTVTAVNIPEGVVEIGNGAFANCTNLNRAGLPSTLTTLGPNAFYGCSSLSNVTLPSGLTSIGLSAFYECASLSSVNIPNSVQSIGTYAFKGSGITSVTVPSSVTSMGEYVFEECKQLKSAALNVNMATAPGYTFRNCTALQSVSFGEGMTTMNGYMCFNCTSLTNVSLPSSLSVINPYSFHNCTSLRSVTLPSGLTKIATYAFANCTSLEGITIPGSCTSLGKSAFYRCSDLTDLTIQNGVTTIESMAFYMCSSLTEITLPNSVTSVGDAAFAHCDSLSSVTLPGSFNIPTQMFDECENLTTVSIGEGVQVIGNTAFEYCTSLRNVSLPSSLTAIGYDAFMGCYALTAIDIPDGVSSIGDRAFANCTNLHDITLPASLTDISQGLFSNSLSFTSIEIPYNVTSIGANAFSGCSSLSSVVLPEGLIYIGSSAFASDMYLSQINLPDSVEVIADNAFSNCLRMKADISNNSYARDYCISHNIDYYNRNECPEILRVYMNGSTSVGQQQLIYVETPIRTQYLRVYNGDGMLIRTMTLTSNNGITDSGDVRTWAVSTGANEVRDIGFVFYASEDGEDYGHGRGFSYGVIAAPDVLELQMPETVRAGQTVSFTVLTDINALGVIMLDEDGNMRKYWEEGYTDDADVRTWSLTCSFYESDDGASFTFKATAGSAIYGEGTCSATVNVLPTPPNISSVKATTGLQVGQSFTVTVTTDKKALYLAECESDGTVKRTFTTGYTDTTNSRVWTIDGYTANSESTKLYFTASADMQEFGNISSVTVTATAPGPELTLISAPEIAYEGEKTIVTVATETRVKYVSLFDANGTKKDTRRTYTEVDGQRIWEFPITIKDFTGEIDYTLKASTDNKNYGAPLELHFRVVPFMSEVSDVVYNELVSNGETVPYVVTTDTRANYIALYNEDGTLLEKWNDGYMLIDGNREWTVFHTLSGIQEGDLLHLKMKASVDDVTYSEGFSITENVLGPIPEIYAASIFADGGEDTDVPVIQEGATLNIAVTTGNNARYIGVFNTHGQLLQRWSNNFIETRGIRSWSLSYTLPGSVSGNLQLVLKASNDGVTYGPEVVEAVTVQAFVPDIIGVGFPNTVTTGETVSFSVTTGIRAQYITLYDDQYHELATWTTGYTDNNSIRTWRLTYRVGETTGYTHYLFRSSADGVQYGSYYNTYFTINPFLPDIVTVEFAADIMEGVPTQITLTTSLRANYISLYDSSYRLLATWTEGYEVVNNMRRWTLPYTFSGITGSTLLHFRASNDGTNYGSYYNKTLTLSDYIPDVISASMTSNVKEGDSAALTVVTSTRATGISLFDAEGALLTGWIDGYTDSGDTRTWNVSYMPIGRGTKNYTVKATADGTVYGAGKSVSTVVEARAEVIRASFDDNPTVGIPVSITVVTTKAAKRICMCYETGGTSATWTSGYTETEDSRVWNVSYTFSGSGDRKLTFKASADGGSWDAGVPVEQHVYPAPPKILSTNIPSDMLMNTTQYAQVVTPTTATHLKFVIDGISYQHIVSSGYTDSGSQRTWSISFGATTPAGDGMTFRASADGVNYGEAYHVNTIFHLPVVNVSKVTAGTRQVVNEPVSFTVTAASQFEYVNVYENDQLINTVHVSKTASANVQHTFATTGSHTLTFKVSGDNLVYGTGVSVSVNISDTPADVLTAVLAATKVAAGKAVKVTATTTTNAETLSLYNPSGSLLQTWDSRYATVKNNRKTWIVEFTAGNPGSYTYTVRANAANGALGNTGSVSLTVTGDPVVVQSASFAANTVVGKQSTFTVVTSKNATSVTMYAENGSAVKKWTSGYTVSGNNRTWTLPYTFATAGNRSLSVTAASSNVTSEKKYFTVQVGPAVPKITSVTFPNDVYVGDTVSVRIRTDKPATRIEMYSEGGYFVTAWTSTTAKSDWNVYYTFSGSGNRRLTFKASADGVNISTGFLQDVTVGLKPSETTAVSVYGGSAVVGQNATINVTTSASAKYVRMYAENGGVVRTWTGLQSGVTGTKVWNLDYSFAGEGYRTLTFASSNDGTRYDSGVKLYLAVNPAVPKIKSASFNKTSVAVGSSVGITVTTNSNASYLALCSENGGVCKIWAASGNSTVSGNTRTWNVSYSFAGAGNRNIGFKTAPSSGAYGDMTWVSIKVTP